MEEQLILPDGLRRMVVLALEIRVWDDETSRFIRTDIPPRVFGAGEGGTWSPFGW